MHILHAYCSLYISEGVDMEISSNNQELLWLVIISPILVTLKGTCIFKANTAKKTLNISTQDIWYLKSYL